MKKNYFFLFFLLSSGFFSFAQPVLTSSSFTDYLAVGYNVPDITGVTLGSAGANQNWNYSGLVPDTSFGIYQETIPYSSAPVNPFTEANINYCLKVFFSYGEDLYENFIFVKLNSNGSETFGYINQTNGIIEDTITYCDTPTSVLPLNYGDSYTSSEQETCTSPTIASTDTYDAYGSLSTVYGTFTNVIRLKYSNSDSTSIQYSWYQLTPAYLPLMDMKVNSSNVVTNVTIYQNTADLGFNENNIANKIIVYPNPATNYVNLKLSNNNPIDKIIITNLLGETVLEETQNTSTINVENLSNGLYLLQVNSNGQKIETKFLKQ